ncbi:MAG: ATP-binding protein [Acidobacteriota bacterium]
MRAKSPYGRLRSQMLVVLLCFGFAPLVAMGLVTFLAQRDAVQARTRNVLEAMVKNRKATVELFLEEKLRQLELLARALPVAELSRPVVLEALRQEMQREGGAIVDLGLISEDGRHVAYDGPYALQDRNYRDQPWFEQVMVLGRYESDVFMGFRRFPHMVMAVKKREAGRDWILRATIDTDRLSALVREGGLESGADVFILNRAGEYQTRYSEEHRLMERADIGAPPQHSGVRVSEQPHGDGQELIATAWLRGDAWVLVARQEVPGTLSIVLANPTVNAVFLIGVLGVPALSVLVARHRLRQIRSLENERAALYESVAQSEKMATIGRLAASIAHEINNPLAIIQEQVGVLSDTLADTRPDELTLEIRDRLAKIHAQVQRGKKVTHRLLGFSRRIGPDVEPVDVAEALNETVAFLAKEAEANNIRIIREFAADVPIIRSSLAQMQQVFLNLLNNAIDAIGHDGEVTLTVAKVDAGVRVSVADNGPGIPARQLERIFEPFFSTKTASADHTGLGLAICRETMQNLGGEIKVEGAPGHGTTFTLWFPPEPPAERTSDPRKV